MDFFNRRTFLRLGGMSLAFTAAGSLASKASARRLPDMSRRTGGVPQGPPTTKAQTDTPLILTIFLRGGADGLNITIPTESGEHGLYTSYRTTIGVPLSAMDGAGTRLMDAGGADTLWGLHPRATELMPLWNAGELAVFPDVHYDNGSRSHFDSQQFYENATPYNKFTPDGWANRALATSGGTDALRAVAFETFTPFALQGPHPTLTVSSIGDLSVSPDQGGADGGRNGRYLNMQEAVYPTTLVGPRHYDPEVSVAGSSLVDAIRRITALTLPNTDTGAAAIYPSTVNGNRNGYFGDRLIDLAKLIKSNAFAIEMAEIDLHGWDTHQSQDIAQNGHPNLVETLARGIRAFTMDLGDTFMRNTVIFVVSEFGRTSRENGSMGTDHGSATAAFVVGHASKVLGRRVLHGPSGWAGLADLRDGRDLKHSTDYRNIISELVSRHMGNDSPEVLPGWTPTPVGVLA